MTKITRLEKKPDFQGKSQGFKVTLDNGIEGNLQEKESDGDLKIGDDVVATVVDYVSKAGKHSNLITLKRFVPSFTPPEKLLPKTSNTSLSIIPSIEIFKVKAEALIRLAEVIVEVLMEGRTTDVNAVQKFNEWKVIMENAIDDIAREL
jgi:hypothetical protein